MGQGVWKRHRWEQRKLLEGFAIVYTKAFMERLKEEEQVEARQGTVSSVLDMKRVRLQGRVWYSVSSELPSGAIWERENSET